MVQVPGWVGGRGPARAGVGGEKTGVWGAISRLKRLEGFQAQGMAPPLPCLVSALGLAKPCEDLAVKKGSQNGERPEKWNQGRKPAVQFLLVSILRNTRHTHLDWGGETAGVFQADAQPSVSGCSGRPQGLGFSGNALQLAVADGDLVAQNFAFMQGGLTRVMH